MPFEGKLLANIDIIFCLFAVNIVTFIITAVFPRRCFGSFVSIILPLEEASIHSNWNPFVWVPVVGSGALG